MNNNLKNGSEMREIEQGSNLTECNITCVQTLTERMKGFSDDEIERGRKARKLYHAISAPDLSVMKKYYDQLCDNTVPWEDIVLAEKYLDGISALQRAGGLSNVQGE